jgi:DMSO reductase anchor subunit
MWRRSWLSREVLLFTLFAGSASAFAAATLFHLPPFAAIPTMLLGLAGVTASAFIYLVPARPAWNNWHTLADFHLTGLVLGPAFLRALGVNVPVALIATFATLQLLNQLLKLLWLVRSEEFELLASARLLSQDLKTTLIARLALLVTGGIALTLAGYAIPALLLALAGELAGRYLFFVAVVPRNMALPWLTQGKSAA